MHEEQTKASSAFYQQNFWGKCEVWRELIQHSSTKRLRNNRPSIHLPDTYAQRMITECNQFIQWKLFDESLDAVDAILSFD